MRIFAAWRHSAIVSAAEAAMYIGLRLFLKTTFPGHCRRMRLYSNLHIYRPPTHKLPTKFADKLRKLQVCTILAMRVKLPYWSHKPNVVFFLMKRRWFVSKNSAFSDGPNWIIYRIYKIINPI
ncbi:hypothetical protein [Neisseria iguanae]|uniref:hypothetical protein n=1 Tax=Neisseria iguanae TaxID=90242 RepID=UPI0011B2704C|nr:hypothetical protein [Neisseria iguanae]